LKAEAEKTEKIIFNMRRVKERTGPWCAGEEKEY